MNTLLRAFVLMAFGVALAVAATPGKVVAWGAGEPGITGPWESGQSAPPASTLQGVLAMSAIEETSAALLSNGSVVTWGRYTQSSLNPPSAASSGVIGLSTGPVAEHFLAIKNDGTVAAWGRNSTGQVTGAPNGNVYDQAYPVTLGGQTLTGVIAAAAGRFHSVVLKNDGTVTAWGSNLYDAANVPPGLSGVVAIAAGYSHSLALKNDGTVVSWGANYNNQTDTPSGLSGVVAITACSSSSFALKSDGTVVGWGLATGPGGGMAPPAGLTDVVAITGGGNHVAALKSDGSIITWGNNTLGQLILPATGLTCPIALVAGANHTLALVTAPPGFGLYLPPDQSRLAGQSITYYAPASGSPTLAYQWYRNGIPLTDGSRVSGATTSQLTLTALQVADNGLYHATATNCAGTAASTTSNYQPTRLTVFPAAGPGRVVAWGDNTSGQLAVPNTALSGVIAVSAGQTHTLALKSNGSVLAWGANNVGQSTVPPAAASGIVAISAGQSHNLAITSGGMILNWGNNADGQTNIPSNLTQSSLGSPAGLAIGIAAGGAHSVALLYPGTVVAWGNNGFGQCTVPPGLGTVTAIAAGFYHTVALRANGTVAAWGDNTHGQCSVPPGLSGVVAISAGFYHTVAVKSDGSVVAWGAGAATTSAPHLGQSAVPAGLGFAVAPAAGRFHSLALLNDRTVVAWGDDSSGQASVPGNRQGSFLAVSAGWIHNAAIVSGPAVNINLPLNAYVGVGQLLHLACVADGTPPLSYQWQKMGAMGYADIRGATGGTLILSDVQSAQGGNYRVVVANAFGSATSAPITVTTLPATTLEQWNATQFNSAQLADPQVSGPLAAPAGDGVPNLLKYAFNTRVFGPNPMAPAPVGPSGLAFAPTRTETGALRLDFHAVRTDVAYIVEGCDDLAFGAWSTDGVMVEANGTARGATYMPRSPGGGYVRIRIVR